MIFVYFAVTKSYQLGKLQCVHGVEPSWALGWRQDEQCIQWSLCAGTMMGVTGISSRNFLTFWTSGVRFRDNAHLSVNPKLSSQGSTVSPRPAPCLGLADLPILFLVLLTSDLNGPHLFFTVFSACHYFRCIMGSSFCC